MSIDRECGNEGMRGEGNHETIGRHEAASFVVVVDFFERPPNSDVVRIVTLESAYQNQLRAVRSRNRTSRGEPFVGAGLNERERRCA